MRKSHTMFKLLLLVAVSGGTATAWREAGYYASDIQAANAGASAIRTGDAFARKVTPI